MSCADEEEEDVVKGKFGYLAPEVTLGQGVDKRVDVFAAGILPRALVAPFAGALADRGDRRIIVVLADAACGAVALAADHRDLVQRGLDVKKVGNEILELVGGPTADGQLLSWLD